MRPISESKADQDKKIFVGGLSHKTNEESLRAFYSKWGEITDVVVMKDPRSNKSRGFGFVTYKEAASVDKAQASRPHVVDNKEVDSKRAMPREETNPEVHAAVKKIYVGRLKRDVKNDDLAEYFGQFGNVTDASVVLSKETNTSRGFAFVSFDDTDSVDKVILARPHMICGQQAEVRKAVSREEKFRSKPPPARTDYNQPWNEIHNSAYHQNWDQGYQQPYGHQPQYGYNNAAYGYSGYDGASGWSNVADGFGTYQQQSYGGGPMRAAPTTQYSRPGPYTGNGWQQR